MKYYKLEAFNNSAGHEVGVGIYVAMMNGTEEEMQSRLNSRMNSLMDLVSVSSYNEADGMTEDEYRAGAWATYSEVSELEYWRASEEHTKWYGGMNQSVASPF